MTIGRSRVDIRNVDLSLYVDSITRGYVTMLLQTQRGPINSPVAISSWEEFERVFGRKFATSNDPLVAEMALKQGAKLNVIRVAHYTDSGDLETLTAIASTITLDDRATTPVDTLKITAVDAGAWGNNLKVYVYDSDFNPGTRFDIRVTLTGQSDMNEYWSDLSMDSTSDRYVVNVINGGSGKRSNLITVEDLDSATASPNNQPALSDTGISLASGSDGGALGDDDYIGDPEVNTGLYAADLSQIQSIDIMIPGTTSITVAQALVTFVEDRGDMVGYAMIPNGLSPADALEWRYGTGEYSHDSFNSERLVLTYGRPLVYDSLDDTKKYISNLGHFAACLAKTDNYYDYHNAPVGPKRGTVNFVEGIEYDAGANRSKADQFANAGITYLTNIRDIGIQGATFWEQRTTLLANSAFRDLNVVRFLTVMKLEIQPVLRTFLFDSNTPGTWKEIHRTLEPKMEDYLSRGSVNSYLLQTDRDAYFEVGTGLLQNATLNTGQTIDEGKYLMRIFVQPVRTIYVIQCDFVTTRTGEAYVNYTQLRELPGAWIRS